MELSKSDVFGQRCKNDPEGVIKDLISQSTKQAKEIRSRGEEIAKLEKKISNLWSIVEKIVPDDLLEEIEKKYNK